MTPEGWVYELVMRTTPTEFTAVGLDAAHRVVARLNTIVKEALEQDPEVIAVLAGPYLWPGSSAKNFVNKGESDAEPDQADRPR